MRNHKIKRRVSVSLIAFIVLLSFLIWKPVLVYRLPVSTTKILKAEIKYQMVDLGFDDIYRNYFENRAGNSRVYLNDDKIKWLYVDSNDRKKLWPESPFTMKKKNYRISATFKVKKLLFGGYSVAVLADTVHVRGVPEIHK